MIISYEQTQNRNGSRKRKDGNPYTLLKLNYDHTLMSIQSPPNSTIQCPQCAEPFESIRGMKIHHSKSHGRSLDYSYREEMKFFEQEYGEHQALVTIFDGSTGTTEVFSGQLKSEDGYYEFSGDGRHFKFLWLGGEDPSGYYVYSYKDQYSHDDDEIGRVVNVELFNSLIVTANEDDLKSNFQDSNSLTELIKSSWSSD